MLLSLVPHVCSAPVSGILLLQAGPGRFTLYSMYNASDETIRTILTDTRVIALVGFSAKPARPSHGVARFLVENGYRVIPVNPGLAGQVFEGETVRASLSECPGDVDMVDIFRRSDQVCAVVDDAIAYLPKLRTVWMQIGVVNETAARTARAHDLRVVWDRCPRIEMPRLCT